MKPQLLVVDDNEANRDMLSQRLIRKGYGVETAENGRDALALIEAGNFDLILLDIMMPGMSGIEVLRTLREKYSTRDLPIIMATANDSSESVVEALECGANDYVTKPINFPMALARVESQLRQKSAEKAKGPETATGPGTTLVGKYILQERLGAGAFGTVYKARHIDLETEVAVKILQASVGLEPDAVARFRREGVSACRVRHPNAVSVLDFGVISVGTAYLVMELLEGHSLQDELTEKTTLSVDRCSKLLGPICAMLSDAHGAGLVHRDIKPANIFLHQDRSTEVVKVLDFGIAKLLDDADPTHQLTAEGRVLGTPAYMAPERFNDEPYDGCADVYSVGIMLYQMLGGRLPFKDRDLVKLAMMHMSEKPEPLRRLNREVPASVEKVILNALAKRPEDRPTARELPELFARALARSV